MLRNMKAIRIHPDATAKYSATNPATTSALHVDNGIPVPEVNKPNELLVKIKASTIVRDMLTWPELIASDYQIPGNDFSGIVQAVHEESTSTLRPGDEVFGMIYFEPGVGGTWAEYAVVIDNEIAEKPANLSWEEAASVPLSVLTAWQALFHKAGLPEPDERAGTSPKKTTKVLITGAAGAVGLFAVQLASMAGFHTVAATGSTERDKDILKSLEADEILQYDYLSSTTSHFDAIVDTVGGKVLESCWPLVQSEGTLVSIDSGSFTFAQEHWNAGIGRDDVNALFFIVEPSASDLATISRTIQEGRLKTFVAITFPMEEVRAAYDAGNGRFVGRGKVVLTIS